MSFCGLSGAFPRIVRGFLNPTRPVSGRRLAIECHVDGVPPPTVTWTKDNFTLSDNMATISLSSTGVARLVIKRAKEGVQYSCIARNGAGSVSRAFTVNIDCKLWCCAAVKSKGAQVEGVGWSNQGSSSIKLHPL